MRAVASALGVLLTAATTAPAGAAPSGPAWRPCPENQQVQCAAIRVPVDWSRPGAGSLDLAVARRPATDPAARVGTLVLLPGGPGSSGVDQLLAGPAASAQVASRFDVVSFDPRGFGRSHPLRCDSRLVGDVPDIAPGPGRYDRLRRHDREVDADCRARSGPLADHVDSASVARDVEALRRSLGQQRISLYAVSYGTVAGQEYAERYGAHLRALVLDSVFDHAADTRGFLTSTAAAAEDSFAGFARWCDRDQRCALHGQDVGAVYDGLRERAGRGELTGPDGGRVGMFELSRGTTTALYRPDWPGLADRLRALRDGRRGPGAAPAPPTTAYPAEAVCADRGVDIRSDRDYERDWRWQHEVAPHLLIGQGGQAAWGCLDRTAANPPHPPEFGATPPVLLLQSRHDPATPHRWATDLARRVPTAALLTYDGWGHGVYGRDRCTVDVADRYLLDLRLPPRDAHCPAA